MPGKESTYCLELSPTLSSESEIMMKSSAQDVEIMMNSSAEDVQTMMKSSAEDVGMSRRSRLYPCA